MPGSTLYITVKPKSPRNEVLRTPEGVVVRVTAPPIEGAANTAVLKALAEALHLPKSRLAITAGSTGRLKRIIVSGLSAQELTDCIAHLPEQK